MINNGVVHLWYFDLDEHTDMTAHCKNWLSPDEIERCKKYVFEIHKTRFAQRRGLLKMVLSVYLQNSAQQLGFSYNEAGKPYLDKKKFNKHIFFNLSHSDNHMLLAITHDNPVGVDIEKIKRDIEVDTLSELIMSENEYRCYHCSDLPTKIDIFYRLWSRKESVVKALGTGLLYPIQDIQFARLDHGKNIVTLRANRQMSNWHVYDLDLGTHLSSAVTIKSDIDEIVFMTSDNLMQTRNVQ